MTNSYYNRAYNPLPSTKIRAKDLKDEATRVEQGFDKLPSPGALAGGQGNYAVDTGSVNAIVIAISSQVTALADGVSFKVRIAATNTGATTLTPGALGSPAVVRVDGTPLQAGDVIAGQIADFTYSSAMSKFQLLVSAAQVDADVATTQAGIATAQAIIATTQAGIATTAAGTATAQAAISTAQAVISTTQAGTATTQAGIATSAAAAALAAAASIGFKDVVFIAFTDSPYTVTQATSGKLLSVDTSGGAVTVNMPTIAGLALPYVVGVKKATGDANAVTINRGGTDVFDGSGATSKTLTTESGLTLIPDTDTAPDRWTTIAFGGANAGAATGSGLTMATNRLLGRSTPGTGALEEIELGAFMLAQAAKAAPVNADGLLISDSAAAGIAKYVTLANYIAFLKAYFDTQYTGTTAFEPQMRLTLVTATPVMTTTQSAKTTVYCTPVKGGWVPLYNGTAFVPTKFAEVSQATTDATKSPAAVAASKVYDLYAWTDSGTLRVTRGPAWTNDTTRGYTHTVVDGIALNTSAITNGPAASRGTWIGTIRSNGSSQIDFIYGASGTAAWFGVWNAYNQVTIPAWVQDATASWSISGGTGIQALNTSAINRISFVRGSDDDAISCRAMSRFSKSAGSSNITITYRTGIGLNSSSAFATNSCSPTSGMFVPNNAAFTTMTLDYIAVGDYVGRPGLGFAYFQQIEHGVVDTLTVYGAGDSQISALIKM